MLKTTPFTSRTFASLVAVSILGGCQAPQETCCHQRPSCGRIAMQGTGAAHNGQSTAEHPSDLPPAEHPGDLPLPEDPATADTNPSAGRDAVTAPKPIANPYLQPSAAPQPVIPMPARPQQEFNPLARLNRLGAQIEFAESPADASDADRLSDVISIDLSGTLVTDDDLALLVEFPSLHKLDISETKISDIGMQHLGELTVLQLLWLNDTAVSSRGLSHIAGMTTLKSLGLTNTRVTDDGLIHLGGLKQLEYLLLSQNRITDSGLTHLSGLTQLEGISLIQTRVTIEGVRRLKQSLPNCQIVADAVEKTIDSAQPPSSAPPLHVEPEPDSTTDLGNSPSASAVPVMQHIMTRICPVQTACAQEKLDPRMSKVLRILLSDPLALEMLGQYYLENTQLNEAVAMFDAAVLVAPAEPTVRYRLAVALARLGDVETAMPHFVETVGKAAAYYNVGVILYDRGELAASEQNFESAIGINPNLAPAQTWLKDVRQERIAKARQDEGGTIRHAQQQDRQVF